MNENKIITEILNDKDIKEFIKEKNKCYEELKMTLINDINELSTDKCEVLCCAIGLNYISSQYGDILGAFKYIDGRIFEFRFHVHRLHQKYADLSNKMVNLEKVVKVIRVIKVAEKEYNDCYFDKKTLSNVFGGYKAYDSYYSLDELDDESKSLRILMKSLINYSRKNNYCGILRKSDKNRIKYLSESKGFFPV